jgi:hypothetical protein
LRYGIADRINDYMFSNPTLWFFLIYGIGYLAMVAFIISRRKRREGRFPLGDDMRLMRQPGESLGRKLAQLDEKLSDSMCWAGAVPILAGCLPILLGKWFSSSWAPGWLAAALSLFVAGIVWGVSRIGQHIAEYRHVRLGLYGERVVGDQLDELKSKGFRVFHDVPCVGGSGPFNLDHVVVGGGAVVVVETKTRRKKAPEGGGPDHRVTFDGEHLIWPCFTESESVGQVIGGTEWLKKRLKKELALDVQVFPVIAIPGWFVDLKSRGSVIVSNEKPLAGAIRHQCGGTLTASQEDLIARHLSLMCRDVDFAGIA